MKRVVIVGRGAAGKSTLARQLAERTGLRLVELDKVFWPADLTPKPKDEWAAVQREIFTEPGWIADGDLGPYDVIEVRLGAADTVIFLDFSVFRCAWRALRRSRERSDFWRWLITYSRREMLATIRRYAPDAELHVLRGPRAVGRFLATLD